MKNTNIKSLYFRWAVARGSASRDIPVVWCSFDKQINGVERKFTDI
jgi:hypothetical protein